MNEISLLKNNNLTKLQGILTSNIRTRASSNTPYYAFFRKTDDNQKHSRAVCERTKCQECEIPVIFRLKATCQFHKHCSSDCRYQTPNLKKGEKVLLRGNWAKPDHSSRPSFTAYSYQLANEQSPWAFTKDHD